MQLLQYAQRFQDSFFVLAMIGLVLLLVTHLVCLRFYKAFPVSPLSGGVIMALALYVAECLPQYQPNEWIQKVAMLQVVVLWIYASFSLTHDFFLKESIGRQSDRFGLSAWVVSTALVAMMINGTAPLQHGVILLLAIFALLLWCKYVVMVSRVLVKHVGHKWHEYISVPLLLGAAATSCVAWLCHVVFQARLPYGVYQSLITLSYLLYVAIFVMWVGYYCRGKLHHLFANWGAENSLIFGVAAVVGMVTLTIQGPDWFVDVWWYWSFVWCCIVTIIDFGHVCVQLAVRGLYKKLIVEDVRLWLRVFSYTMFYVYTWYYYFEHFTDNVVAVLIAEYGLNVVSVMFVVQIAYFTLAKRWAARDASSCAQ